MKQIPRHQAAFIDRIISLLSIKSGDVFLDCTLGDGSHTQAALEVGAVVISLDVDETAIVRSKHFIPQKFQKNWFVFRKNFSQVKELYQEEALPHPDIILMDLGTSQAQLVDNRGLSFQENCLLDMRLDKQLAVTAKDLVNGLSVKELTRLFFELADEPLANRIAKEIVFVRRQQPITTTKQLADLIIAVKKTHSKIHPATKVFQALRMAVNLERESLSQALPACFSVLKPGGRFAVISFHSGEDRPVKHYFRSLVKEQKATRLNQKPLKPSDKELLINRKIRSAKLRFIIKN